MDSFSQEPRMRPTENQIPAHEFFAGFDWQALLDGQMACPAQLSV